MSATPPNGSVADPLWAVTAPTPSVDAGGTPGSAPGTLDPAADGPGLSTPSDGSPSSGEGRGRRRWPRRVLLAVGVLTVAAIVYVGVSYLQVWSTGRTDQARPVDAIVVMGAAQYDGRPSPQQAARLDHAVELWNDGLAPIVVVTGGNQPGDRFTEAEASAAYLIERGVPEGAIVQEGEGHSSWESLENAAPLLESLGAERILLVSDPFHSLRIRLIAEELGFDAYTSPTTTSPVSGADARAREAKEALGVALGRIIGFERLWHLTG